MASYDKEYIIRYVENELTAGERQQFEADMQKDASLEAEVALCRELKAILQQRLPQDDAVLALRNTLQRLNTKYFAPDASSASGSTTNTGFVPLSSPRSAKRIPLSRYLGGMAAAASVILATVLLWPSGKGGYLDRLGRTEMISTTERGGNADSLLQRASVYFNKQEFDKALPLLDQAVKEDSSSQLALFYRGMARWHTGAVDAARKDLEEVYMGGSALQYEAAFYMALSYAGQKNKAAAIEWLKKIPEDAPVSGKVKELSKKLE